MGITQPQAHVLAHLDSVRGQLRLMGYKNFVKWKLDGKDVTNIVNALQRKKLVQLRRGSSGMPLLGGDYYLKEHPNMLLNLLEGYGSGRKRSTET